MGTQRKGRPTQAADHVQAEVEDMAAELRVLWRVMSAALARDSAGQLTSDRQSKGAREGSTATLNTDVVDAAITVETGVSKLLAEVVPILNLDRSTPRSVDGVLSLLPEWRRSLVARDQPIAGYMVRDLKSWRRAVRQAIGVRRHDERSGMLCPDHRGEHPTELRVEGAEARIAESLLAGPPERWVLLTGPACSCVDLVDEQTTTTSTSSRRTRRRKRRLGHRHATCEWIADRRLIDATGRPTDWRLGGDGELKWSSLDGTPWLEWQHSTAIQCPHCRRAWTDTNQRRLLAAELRALGDKRSASMEAIIR